MRRYILTGTPSGGKTAILRQLEVDGFVVVEEAATDIIALESAKGHETPSAEPSFVDAIVALQVKRQTRLRAAENAMIVFDRSPVCTLALSRYLNFVPSRVLLDEVDRIVATNVYESAVFFVRQQGFVRATSARRITFEQSLEFERVHEATYLELGFRLVDVPAGPLAERVALVEHTIAELLTSSLGSPSEA